MSNLSGSGTLKGVLGGGGGTPTPTDVYWDDILDKPEFAEVATSGSYNDLLDKPTIPQPIIYTAGNGISIDSNNVISATGSKEHYLQSDGNQYIITDFKLTYNQSVEVVYSENGFNSSDWESMAGNQDSNVVNSYDITRKLDTNKISCQYGNNNYHEFDDYNQLYTKRKILMTRQGNCFVDDIYKSTRTSTDFTPNCNLGIFCKNMNDVPSNKFNGRIFSIKIWDSTDVLIHHIVADNYNNTPNMYDLITQTHYYNDGTGSFIYGEED